MPGVVYSRRLLKIEFRIGDMMKKQDSGKGLCQRGIIHSVCTMVSRYIDPMLLVKHTSMQLELRELRKKVKDLDERVCALQSLMHICDITKIFNEMAPRSIYRRFFTGPYREVLLRELIARYNFTGVEGDTDRSIVLRILNKIGEEASRNGVITINGEKILMAGG